VLGVVSVGDYTILNPPVYRYSGYFWCSLVVFPEYRLFIPEVDYWGIFDNSEQPRIKIASGSKGKGIDIFNEELYKKINEYVR